VSALHSFLWLNNTPLNRHTLLCLPIRQLADLSCLYLSPCEWCHCLSTCLISSSVPLGAQPGELLGNVGFWEATELLSTRAGLLTFPGSPCPTLHVILLLSWHVLLTCISLVTNSVEHLFVWVVASHTSSCNFPPSYTVLPVSVSAISLRGFSLCFLSMCDFVLFYFLTKHLWSRCSTH
jgi:hypothetical protein